MTEADHRPEAEFVKDATQFTLLSIESALGGKDYIDSLDCGNCIANTVLG